MFRNRAVSLALVGLFLWVTGCTSYKQIELAEVADYDEVRVTTNDVNKKLLFEPTLENDELSGFSSREAASLEGQWAVPLDRVTRLEARQKDTAGTVSLVVLGFGLLVAVVSTVDWDNSDTW